MNQFSISQLAQYSGIKAHTIRIWEQRYNALKPQRSEGNTRYYDNQQLRRLLNISSLLDSGIKVSELCTMPDKKLFELVAAANAEKAAAEPYEYFISQLVAGGMAYDEVHFEKIFSHALIRFGLKDTYTKILSPMLQRVGLLWATDTIPPGQEHFISNLVRQKLFTAIDSLPPPRHGDDVWLLYLPENEFHEIGLLFGQYLLRLAGRKSIYLGCNIPGESLKHAVSECKANKLLLFLVHFDVPEEMQRYLENTASLKGVKEVCVAGNEKLLRQLKEKKFTCVNSADELDRFLNKGIV